VRRAVIDGVVPPNMGMPQSFAVDAQAAFDAVFAACAAEAACAQRHPALRARWRALLDGLPREVRVRHPFTGADERLTLTREAVAGLVRGPLYAPALAAALPQAIDDAAAGRFEALFALGSALGGPRGLSIAAGMHFSVVCTEDPPRTDAVPAGAAGDFGAHLAGLYQRICADWPRGQVEPAFYRVPPAAAPVLVLSGGLDPVTPPRHGARVAQALGANARHVVVANAGHGVMALGCLRDALYRFVDAGTAEQALATDLRCADGVPRPPAFVPVESQP
jgi:pimeloyl-ACP methyl ester carboxylesterase